MVDDKLGQHLHDRATRGLPLTEDERQQLAAWYQKWDEIEEAMLAGPDLEPVIAEVKQKTDQAWAEIAAMSQRIQVLRQQNAELERENEILRERLRQRMPDVKAA